MGQRYDYKSDVWTLGCILYEMLTLHRPFEGDSLSAVVNLILYKDFKPLGEEFMPIFHKLIDMLL